MSTTEIDGHLATHTRPDEGSQIWGRDGRRSSADAYHQSTETALYVCNTTLDASRAAKAIRAHWGIETTSHYSRDVTLGEDRSRIRTNPGVFARLRSFAFNILKANRRDTLAQDRYRAALGGVGHLGKLATIA